MVWKFLFVVVLATGALAAPTFENQQSAVSRANTFCDTAGQDANLIKNATDSLQKFYIRFSNLIKEDKIPDIYTTLNERYIQLFKNLCKKASTFKSYIHALHEETVWCYTNDSNKYAETLTTLNTVFDKFSDYFCEDNAHNAAEFVKANGVPCYELKEREINRCMSMIGPVETTGPKECSQYKEYTRCVVNEMKSCSPLLGKLTETAFEQIHKCVSSDVQNTNAMYLVFGIQNTKYF